MPAPPPKPQLPNHFIPFSSGAQPAVTHQTSWPGMHCMHAFRRVVDCRSHGQTLFWLLCLCVMTVMVVLSWLSGSRQHHYPHCASCVACSACCQNRHLQEMICSKHVDEASSHHAFHELPGVGLKRRAFLRTHASATRSMHQDICLRI